ncbi:TolC family protein [Candidatus Sumerlaeota bacterium]|nr:TolC family protein [Candidatus Sumerlaeota bacterium]
MAVLLLLGASSPAVEPTTADDALTTDPILSIKPGELPDYDLLRLRTGTESEMMQTYLQTVLTASNDVLTSEVIFNEVPETAPFARMSLQRLVDQALATNLELGNSSRSVLIARSSTTSSEAAFVPFVDLVGDARHTYNRDENTTRQETFTEFVPGVTPVGPGATPAPPTTVTHTKTINTIRETGTTSGGVGFDSGIGLPTGGQFTLDGRTNRTDTRVETGGRFNEREKQYASRAEVRYVQPLLRGGGTDVGTADLRRSRLREMQEVLNNQIDRRNVTLSVISTYFQILQTAAQLSVSRGAITERIRFLEDTKTRYEVGRVDESEILRAEIQVLGEMETAIGRRQQLDEQREQMLILLGVPLDTQISFENIIPQLNARGRVNIPPAEEVVEESLNSRMELMLQDVNIAISQIDYRVSQNGLLPQLDFDAGYNRNDADTNLREATGFENQGWDAGVSFRLPLINIQRREAFRRSGLSLENTKTNRLIAERNLIQEARNRHRSVLATEAQLTILGRNIEQARKSLELINGRFEVGFSTVTEVRLAQDDLFEAETRYTTSLLNYQIELARLYVALGRPLD